VYPLDGLWKLSWKSFPLKSGTFVVDKHEFKMFDYPCKIIMGNLQNNYCPRFKWPEMVTSIDNPIFQESKHSIPPGTGIMECPGTIVWTTTNKEYGEITWTKLSSTISEEQDDYERKRNHQSCYAGLKASTAKRRAIENFWMQSSITGKAWTFVESILKLQIDDICAIAKDDIVYLTERLLQAQMDFKNQKLPYHVDIAYHQFENLDTIKTSGLLSRSEREQNNIYTNFNGSAFGDGIYCSKNPAKHASYRYGDTTILLARKGKETTQMVHRYHNTANIDAKRDFNTLVLPSHDFCVLKSCCQCVPLFRFHQSLLQRNGYEEKKSFLPKLANFHREVQNLLDKSRNNLGFSKFNPRDRMECSPPLSSEFFKHSQFDKSHFADSHFADKKSHCLVRCTRETSERFVKSPSYFHSISFKVFNLFTTNYRWWQSPSSHKMRSPLSQ